jgi:hypothetical protein
LPKVNPFDFQALAQFCGELFTVGAGVGYEDAVSFFASAGWIIIRHTRADVAKNSGNGKSAAPKK